MAGPAVIKRHILRYLRRNLLLALACAGPIAVLFAVAGLTAKADPRDIATALLLTAALAGAFLLAGAIPCFRFVRMIHLQEALFQTTFDDSGAVTLDRVGLTYVSKDWFIRSGSAAFHADYIHSIRCRTVHSQNGVGYRVTVTATDGRKYGLWLNSASDVRRVREWLAARRASASNGQSANKL